MRYGILGPLEVSEDGRRIELARAKERALLAVLLLNANRVVSSDRLIDALWEEHAPSTVQKALRVHISRLRKLLGSERLETRSPGYVLRVDDGELDLHSFEALVGRARSAPPAEACVLLGDALALWRGPPLADFTFDGFARVEIARLDEMRLAALEDRFEAELARGGHRQLVGQLEALVVEHPLRERLREQLMLALYRSGRQADALERYQTGRRVLVHELGIEPGRALRDLHEAILRQDRMLEIATVRARRGAFVGREAELEQLAAGLDDAFAGRGRLCLLVGEPGIGKSRLAEEVVARARARDARVLVGRCWEAGGAPAYWPWVSCSARMLGLRTTPSCVTSSAGVRASSLRSCPSCGRGFPTSPSRLRPIRKARGFACSTQRPSSSGRWRLPSRSCSSWTTSTRLMLHRSYSCNS